MLCEIAHEVIFADASWAQLDSRRLKKFERLTQVYYQQSKIEAGNFSDRLLKLINRVTARFKSGATITTPGQLTETLFKDDIKTLEEAVVAQRHGLFVIHPAFRKALECRGKKRSSLA